MSLVAGVRCSFRGKDAGSSDSGFYRCDRGRGLGASSDRTPVQPARAVGFSGDQAELQLLRRERREANAYAEALRNMSPRRFGDRPA